MMINGGQLGALAVALLVSLAGCGGGPASGNASSLPPNPPSVVQGGGSASKPDTLPLQPAAAPSEYYTLLLENKLALLSVVCTRVEEYRNSLRDPINGHHAAWPEDYPDKATLPLIISTAQFAVRQEENLDAMGALYLAVRIDADHELRIDASQMQNTEGALVWGAGNSWFNKKGDAEYDSWTLSDTDIHSWSDADIYQLALRTYGAAEEVRDGKLVLYPRAISLYYDSEGWGSAQEFSSRNAFSWFLFTTVAEDYDYMLEAYKHPQGEEMGWFFPQEIYETRLQRFFDVTVEQLRSDKIYYNAELDGYSIGGGGGKGEQPPIVLEKTEQDGNLHRLWYSLDFQYSEDTKMVMTIRIAPDGSFQYVSVLPAA